MWAILYVMCKSKVGHRDITPDDIPPLVKSDYRQLVHRILSSQEAGTIRLSAEADRIRIEYATAIEKRLGDVWEHMRDWGGKLVGAMLRIAALIHAAEAQGSPVETPISAETIVAAVKIAECLSSHATATYQIMGADETHEDAKYIWRRIERTGRDEISKRDLFYACKGKFKKVERMEPALNTLAEMGCVREIEVCTGGRPSKKLILNPYAQK